MSLHTTAIQKTICSSDGFLLAASSCKIMNSVCNLLETSRPLFNERSRGWRTEVNPFTAELFSFMYATKLHEVQMHLKQACFFVSLGWHFMYAKLNILVHFG